MRCGDFTLCSVLHRARAVVPQRGALACSGPVSDDSKNDDDCDGDMYSGSDEGCTQGVFKVESRIGSERVLGMRSSGYESVSYRAPTHLMTSWPVACE